MFLGEREQKERERVCGVENPLRSTCFLESSKYWELFSEDQEREGGAQGGLSTQTNQEGHLKKVFFLKKNIVLLFLVVVRFFLFLFLFCF